MPTSQDRPCAVCNINPKYIEINRNLKSEMQMYFKSPRQLAVQFISNMKAVLDFQNKQRSRFTKNQQENVCTSIFI